MTTSNECKILRGLLQNQKAKLTRETFYCVYSSYYYIYLTASHIYIDENKRNSNDIDCARPQSILKEVSKYYGKRTPTITPNFPTENHTYVL